MYVCTSLVSCSSIVLVPRPTIVQHLSISVWAREQFETILYHVLVPWLLYIISYDIMDRYLSIWVREHDII